LKSSVVRVDIEPLMDSMEAGFSDISHFNRLFRVRFGDTPRGVRAGTGGER
jgi:AraC-like DNA-binding protein